jgi:hypothetical protein
MIQLNISVFFEFVDIFLFAAKHDIVAQLKNSAALGRNNHIVAALD